MQRTAQRFLILPLFLLSGAAGLVYELVWTRELTFVFGGTTYAIATVLVAFMGGLGLGSYLAGRVADRLRQPGVIYGALEIAIGLYALAVPLLLSVAEPLYRNMYPHVTDQPWLLTTVRFGIGALVLILPTSLMGATLPLLVRFVILGGGRFGTSVALLYGVNSTGAVGGVLATGFWLIPHLGLSATTWTAAATNIVIGLIALLFFRGGSAAPQPAGQVASPEHTLSGEPLSAGVRRAILVVFAVSGFSAMVYQVAWTRALVMAIGSSTYSFTCILAAFILGIAVGSFAVARFVDRWKNPGVAIGIVQLGIGAAAVVVLPIYGRLPPVIYELVKQYGHEAFGTLLATEFMIIIGVTFVPTLLMGAMFPLVTRAVVTRSSDDEAGATGRAYGVNTIGTILGSFLAGFVFLRGLGAQNAVLLGAMLSALSGAALLTACRPREIATVRRFVPAACGLAVVVVLGVTARTAGKWDMGLLTSGAYLGLDDPAHAAAAFDLEYVGYDADLTVAVGRRKDLPDELILAVNSKVDASTHYRDMTTQLLLGHVPALVAPKLNDACVIGLGCGMTLSAVTRYTQLESVDCVEISDKVIDAAKRFDPYNYDILDHPDPRVRMIRGDGRNHLLLTDRQYDVIISEPSNPWIAGVANLFTREFFELCKLRLRDDGCLCIWIHSYSMSPENFKLITHTLADVFDYVSIWEMSCTIDTGDYALLAGNRPFHTPASVIRERFETPAVRADLYRVGLGHLGKILGRYVTGGDALRKWSDIDAVHTDDNALLEFSAPRQLYTRASRRITEELIGLQGSPFDDAVAITPGDAADDALAAATQRAVDARRARFATWAVYPHPAPYLRALLDAYRRFPGDFEIYMTLFDAPHWDTGGFVNTREGAALMREFQSLPPTITTPIHGATLEELVTYLLRSVQGAPLPMAIANLREALTIRPNAPNIVIELSAALAAAGDNRAAVANLEAGLARGVISVERLKNTMLPDALANAPEFQALLNRAAAASQPAGNP